MPITITKRRVASVNADAMFAKAISLAKTFEENFVELAASLYKLREADPARVSDFLAASRISRRKAQYLLAIHETFKDADKAILAELGWTKLLVIEPIARKGDRTIDQLLEAALGRTAADLKRFLADTAVASRPRSMLLYFTDDEYDRLRKVLLANGAKASVKGKGLIDKEQAIMKLVEEASIPK
jgi:hypothetical protein